MATLHALHPYMVQAAGISAATPHSIIRIYIYPTPFWNRQLISSSRSQWSKSIGHKSLHNQNFD